MQQTFKDVLSMAQTNQCMYKIKTHKPPPTSPPIWHHQTAHQQPELIIAYISAKPHITIVACTLSLTGTAAPICIGSGYTPSCKSFAMCTPARSVGKCSPLDTHLDCSKPEVYIVVAIWDLLHCINCHTWRNIFGSSIDDKYSCTDNFSKATYPYL